MTCPNAFTKTIGLASILGLAIIADATLQAAEPFDIVLHNGRVMNPESGLNATRNVGIRGDRIAEVSSQALTGKVVIDATGLVVAPGFIDLHAHGQSNDAAEYQAHDGVTTQLELETGMPLMAEYISSRQGRALINFGATIAHGMGRAFVIPKYAEMVKSLTAELQNRETNFDDYSLLMQSAYDELTRPEIELLRAYLAQGLKQGALGIGMEHQYYPGAGREEIFRVFEMAAGWQATIFTHVRSMGIDGMQEVIANATATGAPLHIVHVNSSSLGELPMVLEMINGARQRGLDITTEAYPYTAASTGLESAIFDPG